MVNFDVDLHLKGEGDPLLTNSLVLSTASPILAHLLSSLNHCDGCHIRKTIILAEEKRAHVEHLLELLHTKYLLRTSTSLVIKAPEIEELCRRLGMPDILSSIHSR